VKSHGKAMAELLRRPMEDLRRRVAREAALLLYTGQEREFLQAKRRAAEILGVRILPSNREVAEELDRIADEREGEPFRRRLVAQMRWEALRVMEVLRDFHPRLVGSVWRGNPRRGSDIDIDVFSSDPTLVLKRIREKFGAARSEWCSVTKLGRGERSLHIYLNLPSGHEVEVVVRSPEEMETPRRCEIYGDPVTGLSYEQLRQVLKRNPQRRFIPE